MRKQQFYGILLLLGVIISGIIYHVATNKKQPENHELQRVSTQYETEKIALKRSTLKRNDLLKFYSIISVLGAFHLMLIIIAVGIARAKIKASSIHMAQIGQHSKIPVHYKDLQRFYPIAANLSLAEIEASISTSHAKAYQLSRQMLEDFNDYTRVLVGKNGFMSGDDHHSQILSSATSFPESVPSFHELLNSGLAAPGKPFILGFSQGQPQHRELQDLKSVAIAGWQGSGKTFSTAYMIASSVLAYGVHAYIIDPHQHHAESLSSLIRPLEKTGRVKIINPFDTPGFISILNQRLERRLAGEEASNPGILFVIDELARLAKMEWFDQLVTFLERCTEETRKANITFLGSSSKWTARHFKGRADIRACMNSMLIHKTKPSQADLLLEDSREKHLVKQLQHPGEAILVTDFDQPVLVSMPRCTRNDMETVAKMLGSAKIPEQFNIPGVKEQTAEPEIIFLDQHRRKTDGKSSCSFDPSQLTLEMIQEQLALQKQQTPGLTQAEIAYQAGLSPSVLSKILNHRRSLTDEHKRKLYEILFVHSKKEMFVKTA